MNNPESILAQPSVRALVATLSFVAMIPLSTNEFSGTFATLSIFFISRLLDIWSEIYFDNIPEKMYPPLLICDILFSVFSFILIFRFDALNEVVVVLSVFFLMVFSLVYVGCDFYILSLKIKQYREYRKRCSEIKSKNESEQ